MRTQFLLLTLFVFLIGVGFLQLGGLQAIATPVEVLPISVSGQWWGIETIDPDVVLTSSSGIDFGTDCIPRIAYHDSDDNTLKYVYGTRSAAYYVWITDTIDGSGGGFSSIHVADDNIPYISYATFLYDPVDPDYNLRYTWQKALAWPKKTIAGPDYEGFGTSIDFHIGYVFISYYNQDADTLHFMRDLPMTGGVPPETFKVGDQGEFNAIAVKSDGQPRIAYSNDVDTQLMYAKSESSGATWTPTVVDDTVSGLYNDLALDADDRPHISYYDEVNGALKYAVYREGDWQISTVDGEDVALDVGQFTSIALDSLGNPRISYYDVTNGDLKFAAMYPGGSWAIETVVDIGNVGQFSSLALGCHETPYITYYDADLLRLMIAHELIETYLPLVGK